MTGRRVRNRRTCSRAGGGVMGQPLSDIRILDLTHVLAGPYATGQLGLMGAEVIRIERPGGDDFVRRHGGTKQMQDAGLGASFLSQNSGKKSIVLDLKSQRRPQGIP